MFCVRHVPAQRLCGVGHKQAVHQAVHCWAITLIQPWNICPKSRAADEQIGKWAGAGIAALDVIERLKKE